MAGEQLKTHSQWVMVALRKLQVVCYANTQRREDALVWYSEQPSVIMIRIPESLLGWLVDVHFRGVVQDRDTLKGVDVSSVSSGKNCTEIS